MTFKGFNRNAPIVVAAMAEANGPSASRQVLATPPVGIATKAGAA